MTHLAEDHGLCDGKTPINIAESGELVLLLLAEHIELLDGVQSLLLALQLNDVGVGDNPLRKSPHRVLEGG